MNLLLCQRRSPKPGAGGSSPSTPAILKSPWENTQGLFDEHDAEPGIKFSGRVGVVVKRHCLLHRIPLFH